MASFLLETCPIPSNMGEKKPVQDTVPPPQCWQTLCGVAHGNAEVFPPRFALFLLPASQGELCVCVGWMHRGLWGRGFLRTAQLQG